MPDGDRFAKWFMGITSAMILAGIAYVGNRLGDIETRLTVIETRLSQDTTKSVELMVENMINKVIDERVPPKDVTTRLTRVERDIEELKRNR